MEVTRMLPIKSKAVNTFGWVHSDKASQEEVCYRSVSSCNEIHSDVTPTELIFIFPELFMSHELFHSTRHCLNMVHNQLIEISIFMFAVNNQLIAHNLTRRIGIGFMNI